MKRLQNIHRTKRVVLLPAVICACVLPSSLLQAQTSDRPGEEGASAHNGDALSGISGDALDVPLYLLVFVNGRDTGLIAEFSQSLESGRMSAPRSEIEEVGIKPPFGGGGRVALDDIPGLQYVYDEPSQTLAITAPASALIPQVVSGYSAPPPIDPQAGFGAVLNYHLTADFGDISSQLGLEGVFAGLEGRLYSPFGVLTTTGQVSVSGSDPYVIDYRRYNTAFTYANPARMLTLTIGDMASSGLPWTRSVRMGGVQLRRDFSLRSDVITSPLLSYSGVAALPSAIEVYVDSVRAWSGRTEAGPFSLQDIPLITSRGEAVVVLRDDAGNERQSIVPFFATRNLLKAGQFELSLEAGRAREDFAQNSISYGDDSSASSTLRMGITDRLTFQGHLEATSDLAAFGVGFSTVLFNAAEVGLAVGGSRHNDTVGQLLHFNLRTNLAGVDLQYSTTRRSSDYADLAYAFGVQQLEAGSGLDKAAFRPALAEDVLSLSIPLDVFGFGDSSLGTSLVKYEQVDRRSTILSATYSQPIGWRDASLRMNAFKDLTDGGYGVSIGLSVPIGSHASSNAEISRDPSGTYRATAGLMRGLGQETGSYGYDVGLSLDDQGHYAGRAEASYRSSYGIAELSLQSDGFGRISAIASGDGALVVAGGGFFLGQPITDAFAVVNVGVPDVAVQLNNQPVGRTGPFGRALVPGLLSYNNNRVSIDPADLPLGAVIDATAVSVVPGYRSGVAVDFGSGSTPSALVVLVDAQGQFVPVGSTVTLEGSGEGFPVGFDGEVWIEGLRAQNRIHVEMPNGTCEAGFGYEEDPGNLVVIEDVVCR